MGKTCTVLENVWQRQQHRCQEIFNKISSQEIVLYTLQEIFCRLIFWNTK
jgi:predicted transcriptional regulator